MLAGFSSALLSPRHRFRITTDASLQFQQHQHEMGTQRLDLPCSFPRKESPRIAISIENEGPRGSCSFRQNPAASSSSSLVARSLPREAVREVEVDDNFWDRGRPGRSGLKRLHGGEQRPGEAPSKRARGDGFGAEIAPSNSGSSSGNNTHCTSSQNFQEDNTSETETGNGSGYSHGLLPAPESAAVGGSTERQCHELLGLLVACVESISAGNPVAANYLMARLGELASPEGTPVHRVVAYYTEALAVRVARIWPHAFCVAPPRDLADEDATGDAVALRVLNRATPIPAFMHFTMNEIILRTLEGKDRVHIIDFDIKQGLQWPGLLQSLASRPNPPSHVRITGIGDSKQDLSDTGIRLAGLADALRLPFEFHAVVDRFEDVRFWMLHVKEGECVVVNCVLQLHRALYDDGRGSVLSDFLGLLRSTNPALVAVAEQEAAHNDPSWEARVAASLPHYAAVFDAVDAALPPGSPARARVEQMFGREIRNVVACEGQERTERHEEFGTWRRAMEERGGFRCVGVEDREVMQGRMLLRMFSPSGTSSYSLIRQGGDSNGDGSAGITLRWMDQPLYTVSAWAPADSVAGSSTASTSQRSHSKLEE